MQEISGSFNEGYEFRSRKIKNLKSKTRTRQDLEGKNKQEKSFNGKSVIK